MPDVVAPSADAPQWTTRSGFVLATIGSAVGIGSIWKFPYEVGANRGGAFVLVYVAGLALVVVPMMLAEFAIGLRLTLRFVAPALVVAAAVASLLSG